MSTSEKQIVANRLNALRSAGPVTAEGKRRVSLSAMRHAITGQIVIMTGEEHIAFTEFSRKMIESLQPLGPMETQLAIRIAKDSWRLNRIAAVEDSMFALGQATYGEKVECNDDRAHAAITAAVTFSSETRRFELLSLYELRTNRTLNKNLDTLRRLQAARTPAPVLRKNGFVFSDNEIAVAASAGPADISGAD
jgi:hypothetical protein